MLSFVCEHNYLQLHRFSLERQTGSCLQFESGGEINRREDGDRREALCLPYAAPALQNLFCSGELGSGQHHVDALTRGEPRGTMADINICTAQRTLKEDRNVIL